MTIDWIQYNERVVGQNSPTFTDVVNRPLNEVLQASGYTSYETSFPGFASRPLVDATASQFLQSTGGTETHWHTLVTADVSDLPTAATGITKVGTINTGTWQGSSVATTYTDAKLKTITGTTGQITISGTATDPIVAISSSYAGQATITTLGTVATGTWHGTAIDTTYTVAQVVSITGTANRTTIGGTATNPTVDISAAYVGQISITTLGTIATGVWNGTAIANAYIAAGLDVTKLTVGATLPSNVVGSSLTAISTITAGVWNGTSIGTAYTDAKVKTVTGTSGRVTIGGSATDPTFDIASSYVGQATITTLGTITSGTWAATAIGITVGGTGLTSYALGDVIYASATNVLSKLTGNTTSTLQLLSQTGTGTVSAAPVWHTLVTADISDLSIASTGITKVGTIGTGTWQGSVVGATYGGTGVNNGSSTITLGGSVTTAGAVTFAGAFSTTITVTGGTTVTLPTSGTLVNTGGTGASGTWGISVSGNAATATALATARAINGVNFDGTAPITVTAAAGTLTGTTLNATVVTSSLTSVGVLASPHMTTVTVDSGGLTITSGGLTVTSGGILVSAGTATFAAGVAGAASINLPHGVAPTSPNNGDHWTSTAGAFFQINNSTKTIVFTDVTSLSSLATVGTITSGAWNAGAVTTTALTVNGTGTLTSTSSAAFSVGRQGSTNPAFGVDASIGSQASGLNVKGGTASGTVVVAIQSSGSNTSLTVDALGTGTITIGGTSTGDVVIGSGVHFTQAGAVSGLTTITATGTITATDHIAGSSNFHGWTGRSHIKSSADGYIELFNNAESAFSGLRFGGTSASFPMWKRNGTGLDARVGDDSAYTDITGQGISAQGDLAVAGSSSIIYSLKGNFVAGAGTTNTTIFALSTLEQWEVFAFAPDGNNVALYGTVWKDGIVQRRSVAGANLDIVFSGNNVQIQSGAAQTIKWAAVRRVI